MENLLLAGTPGNLFELSEERWGLWVAGSENGARQATRDRHLNRSPLAHVLFILPLVFTGSIKMTQDWQGKPPILLITVSTLWYDPADPRIKGELMFISLNQGTYTYYCSHCFPHSECSESNVVPVLSLGLKFFLAPAPTHNPIIILSNILPNRQVNKIWNNLQEAED